MVTNYREEKKTAAVVQFLLLLFQFSKFLVKDDVECPMRELKPNSLPESQYFHYLHYGTLHKYIIMHRM